MKLGIPRVVQAPPDQTELGWMGRRRGGEEEVEEEDVQTRLRDSQRNCWKKSPPNLSESGNCAATNIVLLKAW